MKRLDDAHINFDGLKTALTTFKNNKPFDHCVVDDFFDASIARQLADEFMSYESDQWYHYKNAIEDKKVMNNWNLFSSADL